MPGKISMPAIERPNAGHHGSGHMTQCGYRLEVRTSYVDPLIIGDFAIDCVWRHLPIKRDRQAWGINIPIRSFDSSMLEHGLVTRVVAEAHRWAFLAVIDAQGPTGALCVETRLVQVEIKTQYSTEEKGVSDAVVVPFGRNDTSFHTRPPFTNEIPSITPTVENNDKDPA